MLSKLKPGDYVAILPTRNSPPSAVLAIIKVSYVGEVALVLENTHVYSLKDGSGLSPESVGYARLATDEHRAAVQKRV